MGMLCFLLSRVRWDFYTAVAGHLRTIGYGRSDILVHQVRIFSKQLVEAHTALNETREDL